MILRITEYLKVTLPETRCYHVLLLCVAGGGRPRHITDSVDSRDPDDWVSRLLRLLERSRGEGNGDSVKERGSRPAWCSCVCSMSKPNDEWVSL